MNADEHHEAMQEGIFRASLIKKDLEKYNTEYYPQKVRALIKAYIETVREIIRQGEGFLDKSENFELGLKVAQITQNYKAFLSTIKNKDD